jgi:hypothetical protein
MGTGTNYLDVAAGTALHVPKGWYWRVTTSIFLIDSLYHTKNICKGVYGVDAE